MDNYEKNYETLRPRLAGLDVSAPASYEPLGLQPPCEDGRLHIELLGRRYAASQDGVEDLGGEGCANINCRGVLIYYLTYGGSGAVAGSFQQLHGFSQGLLHDSSAFSRTTASRLGAQYADKPDRFACTMRALGAVPVAAAKAQGGADQTWYLAVLPKVPFELRYYRADEEFSCAINLLIDKNALTFLPFETLAVLSACVVKELEHRAS